MSIQRDAKEDNIKVGLRQLFHRQTHTFKTYSLQAAQLVNLLLLQLIMLLCIVFSYC